MICSLIYISTTLYPYLDENSHHIMPQLCDYVWHPFSKKVSSLLFCSFHICLSLSSLILLLCEKIFSQLMWSLSPSYNLQYKFSKPRPLYYWNSGKSRYTPHPISIFAFQHKNSLNGLFPIVRQNSACSDFKQPSYTESGLEKKKRVGSGGGGGEQRTLEKPT